jgi:nucleoside-diphosphate-sugar epimerase
MRECRGHLVRIGVVNDGDEKMGIIGKKRLAAKGDEKNTTLLDRVCCFFQESEISVASSFLPEIQHENDFLENLGLDSMQASLLCSMLELRGCAGFTVVLLMTKSLRQIWSGLHEGRGEEGKVGGEALSGLHKTVRGRPASFWTAESKWNNNWRVTKNQKEDREEGKGELRILLTGVTGFIGPHLLDAVARSGRWTHIVALMRPPLDRVNLVLLPPHVQLDLVPSDIGRPNLGLSSSTWEKLSGMNFDAVLHNAALVNHIRSYDQMKAHNVVACDDLVRLVSSSVVPPSFLFVSTVSSVGPGASEDLASTPPESVSSLGGGYGQSKWVAERRLDGAARAGFLRHLCVCRLGLIGPHSKDGTIANHRDWLHLFVQCCSLLKVRPKMNDVSGSVVEVLPVDVTAKSMAALAVAGGKSSRGEEKTVRIVALDARAAGMAPMNVAWLLEALGDGGGWSRPLELSSWYKRAKEEGGQALVALSVMPRSRQLEDGIFALSDPSLDHLKRGDMVRRLLASIQLSGSDVLECYQKESFRVSWAKGFAARR